MDASQYKDYVLVILLVKYISDKYAGQPDALLDVHLVGFFADMVALKGDKEIGDQINKLIGRLAEANDLNVVIDVANFNDPDKLGKGKEMVDCLTGLLKDGSKNRLRAQGIHKIVDVFNRQVEIERYSRLVPLDEISDGRNNFNLNLPRHIDSTEPEDLQDIDAHLRGGIPERDIDALQRY